MKRPHLGQGPSSFLGLLLAIIGFVLTILCLVGCLRTSARGLYFLKITQASSASNPVSIYYGWQGYCIQDVTLNCQQDRSVMIVPFGKNSMHHIFINCSILFIDVSIVDHLNSTYPQLFEDEITQDTDLNPGAAPNPPHDPKIYPAAVLCLLCSAALLLFCIMRVAVPHRYQDEYYTRGFLAMGACILALLLLILSSVMYQSAITQLNLAFPHLVATQGPGMPMIGCAFAAFTLAGFVLLRGCMNIESSEGYSPI